MAIYIRVGRSRGFVSKIRNKELTEDNANHGTVRIARPCVPQTGTPNVRVSPARPTSEGTMPASVLRDGDLVNAKFRVIGDKPIGAGQFAEVFKAEVVDRPRGAGGGGGSKGVGTGQLVAIKIEREEKTTTRELRALTDLAGCPGICQVLGSGLHKDKHPYIVMQLGGTNLFDVRHKFAPGERTHSKGTISWIGCRVLDTLRSVHEQGYVHRDVKPSNVTVGGGGNYPGGSNGAGASSSGRELLLIDLGLAKKFQTKEDAVASHLANSQEKGHSEPPRGPFRGSTTYASINAHAGTEQGPRDDLWSLLYLLAEAHEGTLPWRSLKTETDDESVKHQTKLAKVRPEWAFPNPADCFKPHS
jgi:serine/threonine protein kinase